MESLCTIYLIPGTLFVFYIIVACEAEKVMQQVFCVGQNTSDTQLCAENRYVLVQDADIYTNRRQQCNILDSDCSQTLSAVNPQQYNNLEASCDGRQRCDRLYLGHTILPGCNERQAYYIILKYTCLVPDTTVENLTFCTDAYIPTTKLCTQNTVIQVMDVYVYDFLGYPEHSRECIYKHGDYGEPLIDVNIGDFNDIIRHCDGRQVCGSFRVPGRKLNDGPYSNYIVMNYTCATYVSTNGETTTAEVVTPVFTTPSENTYVSSPKTPASPQDSPSGAAYKIGVIVGACVAISVVIVVAVFAFICVRRKKNSGPMTTTPAFTNQVDRGQVPDSGSRSSPSAVENIYNVGDEVYSVVGPSLVVGDLSPSGRALSSSALSGHPAREAGQCDDTVYYNVPHVDRR